uniref:B box-type domain-containing protein n=1 Tax=Oryza meridionalis TaxID=40149 RepID=A0A0E0CU90_9ORYZ
MAIDHASPFSLKNRGDMGGRGYEEEEVENQRWPPWLKPLLSTSFFVQCRIHADAHKSECNMYCLDCMNGALCSLCLSHHRDHHAIQIRRSSYHDVIRVSEIQKVLDITGVQTYIINSARVVFLNERPQPRPGKGVTNTCEVCERSLYHDVIRVSEIQKVLDITGVQTYIINSARVVFLNERPQPRPGKGVTNTCEVCERSLLDSFRFCSLGCKIVGTSGGYRPRKKHGGCGGGGGGGGDGGKRKKKRAALKDARYESEDSCTSTSGGSSDKSSVVQSFTPSTPPPTSASYRTGNKRRKGVPHRSPFGSLIVEF